jgi:hypothetical protein
MFPYGLHFVEWCLRVTFISLGGSAWQELCNSILSNPAETNLEGVESMDTETMTDTAILLFTIPTVVAITLLVCTAVGWSVWVLLKDISTVRTLIVCIKAWVAGTSLKDLLQYRRQCRPATQPVQPTPCLPAPQVCQLPSPRRGDTMSATMGAVPSNVGCRIDVSVPSSTRPRGFRGADNRRPRVHIDVAVPSSTRVRPRRVAQVHQAVKIVTEKDLFLL